MSISQQIQFPNCTIASRGANFFVLSLTEGNVSDFVLSLNDRSSITWNDLLLCGMNATGEFFRFGGMLYLMLLNVMTLAKPFCYFCCFFMNCINCCLTLGWFVRSIHVVWLVLCGFLTNCFCNQHGNLLLHIYLIFSVILAYILGHINPILPIVSFTGM